MMKVIIRFREYAISNEQRKLAGTYIQT